MPKSLERRKKHRVYEHALLPPKLEPREFFERSDGQITTNTRVRANKRQNPEERRKSQRRKKNFPVSGHREGGKFTISEKNFDALDNPKPDVVSRKPHKTIQGPISKLRSKVTLKERRSWGSRRATSKGRRQNPSRRKTDNK